MITQVITTWVIIIMKFYNREDELALGDIDGLLK